MRVKHFQRHLFVVHYFRFIYNQRGGEINQLTTGAFTMQKSREEWNRTARQYLRIAFGFDSNTAHEYAESLNQAYADGLSATEAVDRDMDDHFSSDYSRKSDS